MAFEDLKATMKRGPVLGLIDVTKPFEIETDASDFALCGVLIQEGHSIAYESRMLNDAKRRYTVSEKEMLVVVRLQVWRQYLLGSQFVVKTDNRAICHFFDPLLPKLGEYDAILVIVDRLSEYSTFIPTPKLCLAELTAQLFFKHIVKLRGIPLSIVSDRDSRFIRTFWTELFAFLGTT